MTSSETTLPSMTVKSPGWTSLDRAALMGVQMVALGLLGLLAVKAWVDVSVHFDAWWYHLPWAARLVGLVPAEAYGFEPTAAHRFEGFPLLPEMLQGLLWRLSGRVESTNLVSFLSLVAFIVFLSRSLRVPWWLSAPALLAVPLVQAHATSTYVDLLSNLAMATLVLLVYRTWVERTPPGDGRVAAMLFSAAVAAHCKLQLIPLAGLALLCAAPPLFGWLTGREDSSRRSPALRAGLLALALVVVFLVPLKNLVQHGNPVYPLRVSVLGHTLPGTESLPPSGLGGGRLESAPRPVKWFYSVAEVGMGPLLNVKRWTLDSAAPKGSPLGIQGGLSGPYVGLQALLLLWLLPRLTRRERVVALLTVAASVAVAALLPASHLLRYYMFWFICLIALNLHFLVRHAAPRAQWLAAVVFLGATLVVVDASDQNFVRPQFRSAQSLIAERVDPKVLEQLGAEPEACLALDEANLPFLYASIWHPGTAFSILAGPFMPRYEDEVVEACAGRPVIRSTATDAATAQSSP